MLSLLLTVSVASATEVDEIGGTAVYNNNGDMLKLVELEVDQAAVITAVDFAVYAGGDEGDIWFVLYREAGNSFELVEGVLADDYPAPSRDIEWAESPEVTWLVEPGVTYAVGVWIDSAWYYFYTDGASDAPWFADVGGSYQVEADPLPATFDERPENHYYNMILTSEDADADGDGLVAETWGGTDCDDADPDQGVPTTEVPYDGIDQDCDGLDLVDVDGDGEPSATVGGPDCDDSSAAVGVTQAEVCGDGIDNDCSGADAACAGDVDTAVDDDGVAIIGECGCAAVGAPSLAPFALVLAAALARRRVTARG